METASKGYTVEYKDNTVGITIHDHLSFDESLELTMLSLNSFLKTAHGQLLKQPHLDISDEEADKGARAVLYDKTVIAFSYIMDQFFPEAKDLKAKEDGFEKFLKDQGGFDKFMETRSKKK